MTSPGFLTLHSTRFHFLSFPLRNLGEHGFLVMGNVTTNKTDAISVSIPYKYVVYKGKKSKYEFEYIYKLDSSHHTTNRCLFVKSKLISKDGKNNLYLGFYLHLALNKQHFLIIIIIMCFLCNDVCVCICFVKGDWHQYDDIICAEPSKLSRFKDTFWPDQKKSLIQGREIAGNIMLESIFDLLRSWSDINLRSFFIQLNQFFEVYGEPFVYEEKEKKWYSLDYGQDDVSSQPLCKKSIYP